MGSLTTHWSARPAACLPSRTLYCGSSTGKWNEFNNTKVTEVDLNSVNSVDAYIMFYERCAPTSPTAHVEPDFLPTPAGEEVEKAEKAAEKAAKERFERESAIPRGPRAKRWRALRPARRRRVRQPGWARPTVRE